MIPEFLREQATLYVLGELDATEEAAFEVALSRSPELRREVRGCADALAGLAGAAPAIAIAPPDAWASIVARVEADEDPGVAPLPSSQPLPARGTVWWRVAWPVAALFMLGLNVAQWLWPRFDVVHVVSRDGAGVGGAGTRASQNGGSGFAATTTTAASDATGATSIAGRAAPESAVDRGTDPVEERRARERMQRLAGEYGRLAAEYDAFADTVVPLLGAASRTPGVGGVVSVELRHQDDPNAVGTSSLWTRVGQLVAAEGVTLLSDRFSGASGPNTSGGASIAAPGADVLEPYALATLNVEEGLGYLDLYNLPPRTEGSEMWLWLRNEDGVGFTSVGALPSSPVGGSGGFVFRVPASAGRARGVLITEEPRQVQAQPQPTGRVIIRGP